MKKHKHNQRANAVRRAQGVSTKPTRTTYTTLRQMVQFIPEGLPDRLAKKTAENYPLPLRRVTAIVEVDKHQDKAINIRSMPLVIFPLQNDHTELRGARS